MRTTHINLDKGYARGLNLFRQENAYFDVENDFLRQWGLRIEQGHGSANEYLGSKYGENYEL
jgi:hypothetical protein